MKLVRPPISDGPWYEEGSQIFSKDGTCIASGCPLPPLPYETANRKAISQVPEIMDDLEKILWAADRYKDEPKKQTLALFDVKEWSEKALTRMGYTQEEEKE